MLAGRCGGGAGGCGRCEAGGRRAPAAPAHLAQAVGDALALGAEDLDLRGAGWDGKAGARF
jgi:hypothetical protein